MTKTELIRIAGERLYGARWQAPLADALEVNHRTVRRWASGDDLPRAGVWPDLHRLLTERHAAIGELLPPVAALIGTTK